MKEVTLYASRFCPFCIRAKYLLNNKRVPFREISVDGQPQLRAEMTAKAGSHTVPQIWIGQRHIGGCDQLLAAERNGQLDTWLAQG